MKANFFRKKGQSTLETMAVFVIMVLLLGGIFNIWLWGNKQIVKRQMLYNQSRVKAGTSSADYKLEDNWPLERAEKLEENKVILSSP